MAFDYSIMLDLAGKNVLVIGGGCVASRKIKKLCASGAHITVVAPEISSYVEKVANSGQISLEKRDFELKDLDYYQPFFVCAATDNINLNSDIASYCDKHNILVNVITKPEEGNVAIQSDIRRENFNVSISTFGQSPAFSKNLRLYLENIFNSDFDLIVRIYKDTRLWVLETVEEPAKREEVFQQLSFNTINNFVQDGKNISYNELLKKVKQWLYYSLD